MDAAFMKRYLADDPPTIVPLKVKDHFDKLSLKEKKYTHHICRAAFAGQRIIFRQTSPESEAIFDMIVGLHKSCNGDYKKLQSAADVSDGDIEQYLNYASMVLGNGANYRGFGDSKIVPRLPKARFQAIIDTQEESKNHIAAVGGIDALYETPTAAAMSLGYPSAGHISTYYPDSADITIDEIDTVGELLKTQNIMPENSRLRKTKDGNFEYLIASVDSSPRLMDRDIAALNYTLPSGQQLKVIYGDHSVFLQKVADELEQAQKYSANEHQSNMMQEYVRSFRTGSMAAHVESQRHWIRDKGPDVESNIGFIETYRDPQGIRGEFEGFAAVVNKEQTLAFMELVNSAPNFIPRLPWSSDFEKDKFLSPDFTSLEVVNFAGSGIPAGINIPNYDFVRQKEGFKNVNLGNVIAARGTDKPIPFIAPDEQAEMRDNFVQAFEVQVGLHELLGHGCGKLLQETEPGVYNFDIKNPPTSPISEKPITTWYKPGDGYSNVFGPTASAYEECRAEVVAICLACHYDILKIFGHGNGEENLDGPGGRILYNIWLTMARAGLCALEQWDPKTRKWGQSHSQARFAILQVMLETGPELCKLECEEKDGELTNMVIKLDKTKIISNGKPHMDKFLQKLNIYKATADIENARKMFDGYCDVSEWFEKKVRPEVLRQSQPRKVFVQGTTVMSEDGEDVKIIEYPATAEGMIQSFVDKDYI